MKSAFRYASLVLPLLAGCSRVGDIFGSSSGNACGSGTTYTAGSSVSATKGVNDCKGPSGLDGQLYSMTVGQQTNIRVTVATSAFTPLVEVFTANNTLFGETLSGGVLSAFLPAGSYRIFVSSTAGPGGAFTLTTPTTTLGGGCLSASGNVADGDMGYTLKGASFGGQIIATDCGALNAKMHWYRVRLSGTDTLVSTVTVDKPAGVYLINSAGTVITTKELPDAGTWSYTYPSTADGVYSLRIESRAVGTVSNLPLNYTVALK